MSIDYTLWPNTDGQLGKIKTTIPDGVNKHWPDGDILVDNYVYKNGNLAGFVDTKALINNDSKSTIINYDYVNIHLDSIKEGDITFNRGERSKYFNITFGSGAAEEIFKYKGCKNVDDVKTIEPNYQTVDIIDGVWSAQLPDLEAGFEMFRLADGLITFNAELPKLADGNAMFRDCYNMTTFTSNLDLLVDGYSMFEGCCLMSSFNANLGSLEDGSSMFKDCSELYTFNSTLSSLENGYGMFHSCNNLSSFNSPLGSLTNGDSMFYGCKLDANSVRTIFSSLKPYNATLCIGFGCDNNEADKALFASECGGFSDMESLLNYAAFNGWTVTAQYNGRPSSSYSMRNTNENVLPVFVKLIELDDNSTLFYTHSSNDNSKKYNLSYFHDTTGSSEGYTQFASIEEALEHYNIKSL
jgi:hypothetical protein